MEQRLGWALHDAAVAALSDEPLKPVPVRETGELRKEMVELRVALRDTQRELNRAQVSIVDLKREIAMLYRLVEAIDVH